MFWFLHKPFLKQPAELRQVWLKLEKLNIFLHLVSRRKLLRYYWWLKHFLSLCHIFQFDLQTGVHQIEGHGWRPHQPICDGETRPVHGFDGQPGHCLTRGHIGNHWNTSRGKILWWDIWDIELHFANYLNSWTVYLHNLRWLNPDLRNCKVVLTTINEKIPWM